MSRIGPAQNYFEVTLVFVEVLLLSIVEPTLTPEAVTFVLFPPPVALALEWVISLYNALRSACGMQVPSSRE